MKGLKIIVLAAVALSVLLLTATSAWGGAKQADARLDRALRELVQIPAGPPGAIAVVQRGKDREVHRAGVSNQELGGRIGLHQRMRLASVSKAYSGAVSLRLVERGRLRLDRSIREVLPSLPVAWHTVTLRQALQHTSGLPDYTVDEAFLDAVGADPRRAFTHVELIDYVADEPLDFPAGSRYHYSNTDNIVIALMAEAVTGRSYEALLRRLVFRPLGMTETVMAPGFTLPQPFVHGYLYGGPSRPLEDVSEALSVSWVWASGGLVSSPADLNTFIRGYGGKALLGRPIRRQQRSFVPGGGSEPPGPGDNSAGLALFQYRTSCGTVLGHTGNFPGYTQFAATSPSGRRSATVSINLQLAPTAGTPGVFDALRRVDELAVCAALAGRARR
jgi:D-alanyl-D-alanine carboxypeptidase